MILLIKKYVLFAALTGMPFKEMQNLSWGQVELSEAFGIRIKMIRQKTGKPYLINISEQAYSLMGERKEPTDKVFEGINNRDRYYFFPLWLAEVGIKKHMSPPIINDMNEFSIQSNISTNYETNPIQSRMSIF
jgi:integrase